MKKNCWEILECGREPGGTYSEEFGVCPAAVEGTGKNGGTGHGRACWMVSGTYCNGDVQGTFAKKIADCVTRDIYRIVQKEEGKSFEIF